MTMNAWSVQGALRGLCVALGLMNRLPIRGTSFPPRSTPQEECRKEGKSRYCRTHCI
jgi:hypothetical protein